jgi:hypothetical protein
VGLKYTCSVIDWPGFKMTGSPSAGIENPAPVTDTELMVTAREPLDFKLIDWLADVVTATLPKLRLVALKATCRDPPII